MYPADLKYTKDHEWVRIDGGDGRVGITDYAQKQLGDVVYVELPEVGRTLTQGEVFGTIESVKAVSELFAPVSGEVVAVNDALSDTPEPVNSDPHDAWMITAAADQRRPSSTRCSTPPPTRRSSADGELLQTPTTSTSRPNRLRGPPHRPEPGRAGRDARRRRRAVARRADRRGHSRRHPPPRRRCRCRRPRREHDYLDAPADASRRRTSVFRSFIGLGYYDTITPAVILRNVLREPGLVHALHAVPGRDRPGPPRVAAQLPDDGERPDRAWTSPTRRCSTRRRPPPRR